MPTISRRVEICDNAQLPLRRRKLLLLTYHFPPVAGSAAHRWLGFSRHLLNHEWDVVVVAPTAVSWEPNDPALLKQLLPGIEVERVAFPKCFWTRFVNIVFPYETWLPSGWTLTRDVVARHKPDVVLTTSPPGAIHWLGYLVKQKFGLPWIVDLRDPWFTWTGKNTDPWWLKLLNGRAEQRTIHWADRIFANTPSNLAVLQRAYPQSAGKMTVLTNGFDPVEAPVAKADRNNREMTLLYAGEMYAGRDPRPLLRCLAELNKAAPTGAPRFRLKLLGRSDGSFDIHDEVRSNSLTDTVDLLGQVPHELVLSLIANADILVSIQGPKYQNSIPAKVYEYMAFSKPILQLSEPGGDIDWALKTSQIPHRVVSQFDEPGIKQAIGELAAEVEHQRVAPVDAQHVRVFTRAYLAERLAAELDAVARPASETGA